MTKIQGVKKSIIFILIAFCGYVFRYGYNVLLARHMSAAQYGDVSFSLQMISLLTILVTFCM